MQDTGVASTRMGLDSPDDQVATRGVDQMDPDPSYDASDEIEFFFKFVPWGLRGVIDGNGYPPPAYPPV